MDIWQQDFANSYKEKWTYRLIHTIGEWTKRNHGQFYLSSIFISMVKTQTRYAQYAAMKGRRRSMFSLPTRDMLINEIAYRA